MYVYLLALSEIMYVMYQAVWTPSSEDSILIHVACPVRRGLANTSEGRPYHSRLPALPSLWRAALAGLASAWPLHPVNPDKRHITAQLRLDRHACPERKREAKEVF